MSQFWHENCRTPNFRGKLFRSRDQSGGTRSSPPMDHYRPYFVFRKISILVVRWLNKWAWPTNKKNKQKTNKQKPRANLIFSEGAWPPATIFWGSMGTIIMSAHFTSEFVWGRNQTNRVIATKLCQKATPLTVETIRCAAAHNHAVSRARTRSSCDQRWLARQRASPSYRMVKSRDLWSIS